MCRLQNLYGLEAAYLSSPYWCVCVCVVQSETLTRHSALHTHTHTHTHTRARANISMSFHILHILSILIGPRIRIYYSNASKFFNMFRATHRSSSGAQKL